MIASQATAAWPEFTIETTFSGLRGIEVVSDKVDAALVGEPHFVHRMTFPTVTDEGFIYSSGYIKTVFKSDLPSDVAQKQVMQILRNAVPGIGEVVSMNVSAFKSEVVIQSAAQVAEVAVTVAKIGVPAMVVAGLVVAGLYVWFVVLGK